MLRRVQPNAGAGHVQLQSQPSLPIAGAGLVEAAEKIDRSYFYSLSLFFMYLLHGNVGFF